LNITCGAEEDCDLPVTAPPAFVACRFEPKFEFPPLLEITHGFDSGRRSCLPEAIVAMALLEAFADVLFAADKPAAGDLADRCCVLDDISKFYVSDIKVFTIFTLLANCRSKS
jgi:hypothetical protein